MPVTARTLRLVEDLRDQLDTVVDNQTRDLVRAWATAWDEVAPDLNAALVDLLTTSGDRITRTQMLRSQRLMAALALIADMLEVLAEQAGVRVTGDLEQVIATAGAAQASVIDSQLPPGSRLIDAAGWDRVDVRQIDAIVTRSTQRIVSTLDPLPAEVMAVVRRELIRGVAAGSNPRETARRMVQRVEGHVNGRWGLSRALTIARTETISAHREAARISHMENADVLAGWRWVTHLDLRTCPACIAKHGEFNPVEEAGPNGHPNCRCARVPETKSWTELGFPDVEEPPSLLPDARAWFDALSKADQVRMLGRQRLTLLQSGVIEWDDLATLRRNRDWRDSWQVTPLKTLARRTAA